MIRIPRKIEPYYVYTALFVYFFAGNLMVSVSVMYLLSKGLSYFQINFIDSVWLVLVFFLEIPTGIIGDRFGHKVSFQVSMVLEALYYVFLTLTGSFFVLLVLCVIRALSSACSTGSFSAWYIGRLQKDNAQDEHVRLFSNNIILGSIAGISAGFLGAIIGAQDMAAGYRIAAALVVLSVLMLIPIPGKPEPSAAGETNMAPYIPNMKEIVKVTLGFFKSNGAGQWALILPMGIGFIAVSGIDNLWQPLFLEKQNEHLVWILGYAWVFIRLGTLAAGIIARSLRTRVNTQKYFGLALLGSAVFVSLSAWLQLWWLSAFTFALHASAWVLFSVLTDGYLYKAIPGESKATTLSTLSSFYSVTGIMGMLTLSLLADYSIALAFFAASAVFILAFFSAGFLRKKVH